ncbi:hypothetical protein [Sedimentitalea todarodis]|uniref:HXXEE domain-containing protein n=1 Tax=Sedimentitalea todarodis TaxID=1631240 RepID=A0ABU3VLN4_9RHOB|nr:hypothetical protein [Sedimentitalea todarodis]MDU9007085.1 hypothetical protein [Sedimentitalea todarodis]
MLISIFDSYLDDDAVAFNPPPWVSIVAVVALTLTLLLAVFIYLGIWLASIVMLSVVLAFVLWLTVGYTTPISRRALPSHIVLIIALLVHGAEQFRGGYADVVVTAFPNLIQPPNIITDASLALSLSLSATVIWLLGGAMAFYHARVGGFAILLLAVWSLVFPLSHVALPLLSSTAPVWVPGMASGFVVIALAFSSLRFTLNLTRRRPLS